LKIETEAQQRVTASRDQEVALSAFIMCPFVEVAVPLEGLTIALIPRTPDDGCEDPYAHEMVALQ
jgi:hypothetical protein